MALTTDIVETYRHPRIVIRRLLSAGEQEARALMFVILACALIFVAQWPRLQREAVLDEAVPLQALIGGALMGWIFIAPLALYAIALITHWIARALGGKGTAYSARLSLFWSLLAATPLWLLFGLMSGFFGPGAERLITGSLAFAAFVIFWITTFFEVQKAP